MNSSPFLISRLPGRLAPVLLAMSAILTTATTGGEPTPFSRVIVFGDSLSDTGNFFELSSGWPPPPYADGRFSNGPLWVEYLAQSLGMEIAPGDNYAVGGATTGTLNSNNGFRERIYPGLQQQIAGFLEENGTTGADEEALYVLWAGANDFFVTLETGGNPAELIANGVANTAGAVQALAAAGARMIVVPNIPDLGVTPFAQGAGLGPIVTHLCTLYNQALAGALQALENDGIPTIRVDAFTTLQSMANAPAEFGFENVTSPFLTVGGDPEKFLFWDIVHPTTNGHAVFGAAALNEIIEYFLPNQGNASPEARLNALHGLVRAHSAH